MKKFFQDVEAFQVGLQTDSAGQTKSWSEADLREMVDAYNESVARNLHDAPVLPGGHFGSMAAGWVASAKFDPTRNKVILQYDEEKLDPNFVEAVERGLLRKKSIHIYDRTNPNNPTPGRFNIRHLAYVEVPACKGLKDDKVVRLLRPAMSVDNLDRAGVFSEADKADESQEFVFNEEPPVTIEELQAQIQTLKGQFGEVRTANLSLTAERDALRARVDELVRKEEMNETLAFCEGLVRGGQILDSEKEDYAKRILTFSDSREAGMFGEGDDALTQRGLYKQELSQRPALVPTAKIASSAAAQKVQGVNAFSEPGDDFDPASDAVHAKAVSLMQADSKLSYSEAVNRAISFEA